MSVIPLFILMGAFIHRAGLSTDLLTAARNWRQVARAADVDLAHFRGRDALCDHQYRVHRHHRVHPGAGTVAAGLHEIGDAYVRHLLGSQTFDYWRDPFGFRVEHFTDGDVANNEHRPSRFAGTADQTTQWGMNPPADFFE